MLHFTADKSVSAQCIACVKDQVGLVLDLGVVVAGMVGDDRIVISTPYSTYFVSRGHPNYEEVNKVFENLRLKRAIQGICEMPTGQE